MTILSIVTSNFVIADIIHTALMYPTKGSVKHAVVSNSMASDICTLVQLCDHKVCSGTQLHWCELNVLWLKYRGFPNKHK